MYRAQPLTFRFPLIKALFPRFTYLWINDDRSPRVFESQLRSIPPLYFHVLNEIIKTALLPGSLHAKQPCLKPAFPASPADLCPGRHGSAKGHESSSPNTAGIRRERLLPGAGKPAAGLAVIPGMRNARLVWSHLRRNTVLSAYNQIEAANQHDVIQRVKQELSIFLRLCALGPFIEQSSRLPDQKNLSDEQISRVPIDIPVQLEQVH
jgi:hypothetical protein